MYQYLYCGRLYFPKIALAMSLIPHTTVQYDLDTPSIKRVWWGGCSPCALPLNLDELVIGV